MAALPTWGGCDFAPPADAKARLATLEAEGKALDQAADALEARLLSSQGTVQKWEELATRHREVSALACKVSESHLEGMVRHLERQEEKERRKRRSVVAQARLRTQAD
jgi:hypothetical protein